MNLQNLQYSFLLKLDSLITLFILAENKLIIQTPKIKSKMKNIVKKINGIKPATLLVTNIVLCAALVLSFTSGYRIAPGSEGETIPDQAAAKKLLRDFTTRYSAEDFYEHGGQISKATLQGLLSKMTDQNDKKVFYIFGRTAAAKNCIMLFNDPAFNDPNTTTKYMSAAPYCPDDCDQALMRYLE